MALDDIERKKIERALEAYLAKRRPPSHIRHKLDFGWRLSNQSVELFEIRPQWDDPSVIRNHPFAKATYVKTQGLWKVYWKRADLKWHGYQPKPEVASVEQFLAIVDADEYGCFFG